MAINLDKYKIKGNLSSNLDKYKLSPSKLSEYKTPYKPEKVENAFLENQPKAVRAISEFGGYQGLAKGVAQSIQTKTSTFKNLFKSIGSNSELYSKLLEKAAISSGEERKKLVKAAKNLELGSVKYEDIINLIGPQATKKEVLGSAAQVGSNILSTLLPVSKVVPVAKNAGIVTKAAPYLTSAAQSGLTSGISAFGSGIESGKTVGESAKGSVLPAIFGAATGAGTLGYQTAVHNILKKSPTKLVEDSINIADKLEKPKVEKGKEAAQYILDKGWWGKLKSIYNKATSANDVVEKQVDTILDNYTTPIPSTNVMDNLFTKLKEKFGDEYSDDVLLRAINNEKFPIENLRRAATNGTDITLKDVNNAKKIVGKILNDSDWLKSQADMSLSKKIAKETRTILANFVKDVVPETKDLYDDWAKLINVTDRVVEAYNKNSGSKMSVLDWVTTIPAALGYISKKPLEGAVVAGATLGVKKAYESPTVKTGLAQLLKNLDINLEKMPQSVKDTTSKLDRTSVANILKYFNK